MDTWNKLPPDLQEMIQREERHSELEATLEATVAAPYIIREAKAAGVTFVRLPDSEAQEMWAACIPIWDNIGAQSPRAAQIVSIMKEMVKETGRMK